MGGDAQDVAADLAALFADPVRFARQVLQADLWPVQARILAALTKPHARVAVKACHSSGKSYVAGAAALWFPVAFHDGIVLTTAPTWTQVSKVLWGEIHTHVAHARIILPKPSATELRFGPKNFALGLSTNEGVRFQGFRAPHTLIVLDEAPGVRPDIWEAIEGIRAGGDVRVLAIGNPTIPGGPFYDAFTGQRAGWETITISAFDTPNLLGLDLEALLAMSPDELGRSERSYLTTRQWVHDRYHEVGPTSAYWQARVLGEFPEQAEDALISLAWIDRAAATDPAPVPLLPEQHGGDVCVGIDVAGPGEDETVLIARMGDTILHEESWHVPDPRGQVLATLAQWRDRLRVVNIDSAGIGYYLGLHVQDQGYPVRLVNVGESAHDGEKYRNLKAELYWGLRMRFQGGAVRGPMSAALQGQLSTIRYGHNARGQVEIESKEDAVKRGVKSPDRAEAMMLAYASDADAIVAGSEQPRRAPVRIPRASAAA